MESCPAPAVLPLVGLAADKITRDRYILREILECGNFQRCSRVCCKRYPSTGSE
ncbi:MAG: hypothetical protein ACQESR_07740 [Planctomycetota bacterium]